MSGVSKILWRLDTYPENKILHAVNTARVNEQLLLSFPIFNHILQLLGVWSYSPLSLIALSLYIYSSSFQQVICTCFTIVTSI